MNLKKSRVKAAIKLMRKRIELLERLKAKGINSIYTDVSGKPRQEVFQILNKDINRLEKELNDNNQGTCGL